MAMIPHKSRSFWTILDLSFHLRYKGKLLESVNSATNKLAPAEAMVQLGNCVQQLVATMAENYDPNQPFKFAKLDIKDGFWQLAVNNKDAWNFVAYYHRTTHPTTSATSKLSFPIASKWTGANHPHSFAQHRKLCVMSLTRSSPKQACLPKNSKLTCYQHKQHLSLIHI